MLADMIVIAAGAGFGRTIFSQMFAFHSPDSFADLAAPDLFSSNIFVGY